MAKFEVTIKERVSSEYTYIVTVEADDKEMATDYANILYESGSLEPEDTDPDVEVDNTTFEVEEIE